MYLDYGEIQFISREFLVSPNSSVVEVKVERVHNFKEQVEVKWKLVSGKDHIHLSNGTVFFNTRNYDEVIKLHIQNVTRNHSLKIELSEPSNGYQLGENKVANITFVCKF